MSTRTFKAYCDICKKETNHYKKAGKCINCRCKESGSKRKQTCLEKYGVDNISKLPEIREKAKQTMVEKYGVENYSSTKECRKKVKQTNLEKFGGWNSQTEEWKEKVKQTNLEKYGVGNYAQTKECREKTSRKWKLMWEEFSPEQRKLMRQKASKKYNYQEIQFDSSWELAYFIYLIDHNIEFEFQPDPIPYYVDEKKHLYFPDFKIGDQLIEIKGTQFFTESGQFVNPFNRSPEEDFKNKCKYQCMINNNVSIISDISEQMKYIEEKYGVDFIQHCRVD